VLLFFVAALAANERVIVAGDLNGGPFYARLERGLVPATDEWAAIAFYRKPACVRPNFNVLKLFDFASIPAIFL
jgi:hypothetical protein